MGSHAVTQKPTPWFLNSLLSVCYAAGIKQQNAFDPKSTLRQTSFAADLRGKCITQGDQCDSCLVVGKTITKQKFSQFSE